MLNVSHRLAAIGAGQQKVLHVGANGRRDVLLQVFFVLVKAGKELSVGEIQEAVEIPGPTLSHHLDVLRRASLIESRKEERYIYYSVQRERVTALVRLLTACC